MSLSRHEATTLVDASDLLAERPGTYAVRVCVWSSGICRSGVVPFGSTRSTSLHLPVSAPTVRVTLLNPARNVIGTGDVAEDAFQGACGAGVEYAGVVKLRVQDAMVQISA